MKKKLSVRLSAQFYSAALGTLAYFRYVRSVLAGEEYSEGWGEEMPGGVPMDVEGGCLSLWGWMVKPLIFIGVLIYALLFLYWLGKWDTSVLKKLQKIGTWGMLVALIGWGICKLESDIIVGEGLSASYLVVLVAAVIIYILLFVYTMKYLWGLFKIKNDKR